jgi:hypothetical protein
MYNFHYTCFGAPTGQLPAQAPQSIQAASSITKTPPLSLIAPTGQSAAQAPQPMQLESILYAIWIHTSCSLYSAFIVSHFPNLCNKI